MAKIHSSNITFIDLTDSKKVDVHISSNLPTIQIYDANSATYSPDWTSIPLELTLTAYADSTDVTKDLADSSIKWYRQVGSDEYTLIKTGGIKLSIFANDLKDTGIISYICSIQYNNKTFENKITFARTDTGRNGADGKSVNIKGTATSVSKVANTDYYTIIYNNSSLISANEGDAYVYNGDLYVCVGNQAADGTDYFIKVGRIQGPAGKDAKNIILNGTSQVFKVDKNESVNPATITITAQEINTTVTSWMYSTDGGKTFVSDAPSGIAISGNVVVISGSMLEKDSIIVKASDGTYSDIYTVYKVFDGVDGGPGTPGSNGAPAAIAFLTNENVTFGANAQGQIAATAITTNVVAYEGTVKKTPTIGEISGLPSGMTVTVGNAETNEIPIAFTISNNSTLGSAASNNGYITIPITSPVKTSLIFSWSKVNSGAPGAPGSAGSDAYTVMLTNESHVFAGDVANAVAGTATTQVLAYRGTTAQTVTISSINGKTAAITDTDTGIAGLKFRCSALSGTSPTITFTCTNAFVSASGSIPIILSVGGVSFTKMFTYSIAFKGATGGTGSTGPAGTQATAYWLVSSASAVQKTSTGTIAVTPSTLTFTGKSQTGANAPVDYACRWIIAYSTDGTNYTNLYTSTANEASKSITVATTYKTIRARMYMAGGTTALIDEQIIPVVSDGATGPKGNDAYTVMLTNESHIFAGDVSNAIAGSATTQVLAYNGSTAQIVTIVSVNGKTAATADTDTGIAGLKFKCSSLSGASPTITFTCTTSFVSKSGAIPIVLSVGGVSFTKMFTYSIAFKGTTGSPGNPGSPGTPASLVDITPSAYYFKSTTGKDGTFTPDYIYLYPRFQTVTFSKWEYSINGGTTWFAASGANGISISTYNSIANTLRIAKTSTLYTDAITSISFRCVSSNASVYDTVSIAKIYDVVDLQIGGRNLLLNSRTPLLISSNNSVEYPILTELITEGTRQFRRIKRTNITSNPNTMSLYNAIAWSMLTDEIRGKTVTMSFAARASHDAKFTIFAGGYNPTVNLSGNPGQITIGTEWKRFTMTTTIPTDIDSGIRFCPLQSNTIEDISIFYLDVCEWQIELGNKATDWSPAPEDLKSTTFQLYAPKGYLITNDVPTITLETFAYDGSQAITNATFVWYSWNGESWVVISGATGASLTINRSNVFKSNVYKCDMTYGGKVYTATATVEDKTDIYDSLIHITSKYSPSNRLYWILYSTVYSEEGEKDELLGPVSVIAPTSPATGAYWYKIDETNYAVTLMKYSGTAWVATTDKQEFVYDWFMLNDTNTIVTLGERSKVKIVTSDNFSRTCSIQCNVLDQELAALTHSNQVINDPSDPIVSDTEPTNPVNGQLWIKTNANGSYMLLVWDATNSKWVVSEADTQKKVYVQKPTTYNEGDIWIVAAEYEPDAYVDGVLQKETIEGVTKVVKHIAGTMLMAQYASQTYKDSDWIDALKYTKALDKVNKQMDIYNQFFTFDNTGMTMKAKSLNGQISEFSTKLTNTELGFYQGENKVAYINNNQLNISKAEITNGMTIGGTEPMLQIGNFVIMQESNGSLSIGLKS